MRTRITSSRMVSAGVFTAVVGFAATVGYVTGASAEQVYPIRVPAMITGADIGFQPSQEGSRVGTLMIRVDGKWVPAQFEDSRPRLVPAK